MSDMGGASARQALVYCRISQDRDGTALGVERQRQDCMNLAEQLGWKVVRVETDNDISAASGKRRPGYESLLRSLEDGSADAVLCWHTDRLHRRLADLLPFVELCQRKSVEVRSVRSGHIDLSSATGRTNALLAGVIANNEIEQTRERIQRQKLDAAATGKYRGGPRPFGYEPGGMVIRESEAELIRDATRRVLAGASLRSIVREWAAASINTSLGKPFTVTGLRGLLIRWRNAARIERHGVLLDGKAQWPPLVSEEELRAVRSVLNDSSRRTTLKRERQWLGSGVYRCICGSTMRSSGTGRTAKGQRRTVYRCRWATANPGQGEHSSRRAEATDLFVETAIVERLQQPEAVKLFVPDGVDVDELRLKRDVLGGRLTEVADMFATGSITSDQLRTITARLTTERDSIDSELSRVRASGDLADIVLSENIAERWANELNLDVRARIVDAMATVTLLPGNSRAPEGGYFNEDLVRIEWH
ncbi:hypothetical protein CH296_19820 [Rhodococcus sp. 14-2496-1d]|uniref:recombinase family protein n=1 Tax=Rhodococcus sp. 14-2496-1d TaxID=2023146 RepID=UPI000B9B6187|nr:recombinase family protein [Rhodococcus sp. 14-2496-1d]OZF28370.1 hypothetical protein CH296_19820 [Rhodococcus sp. 14-2496-1d]